MAKRITSDETRLKQSATRQLGAAAVRARIEAKVREVVEALKGELAATDNVRVPSRDEIYKRAGVHPTTVYPKKSKKEGKPDRDDYKVLREEVEAWLKSLKDPEPESNEAQPSNTKELLLRKNRNAKAAADILLKRNKELVTCPAFSRRSFLENGRLG